LIYGSIREVVAPSSILVFHFQYALFHVSLMYLGETVAAVLAAALAIVSYVVLVNDDQTALVAAVAVVAANDNTNDVSYARANDLDYYYYCSFVVSH
jgi:hypothetical protein